MRLWRNQNPHTLLVRLYDGADALETVWQVLKMWHTELTDDPAIPFLDNVNTCPQKNLYTNVHGSITHIGQKVETLQMPTADE